MTIKVATLFSSPVVLSRLAGEQLASIRTAYRISRLLKRVKSELETAAMTVPQPQVKAIRDWMATQTIPDPANPAVQIPKYTGVRKVLCEIIADAINSRWKALATTTQIANKKAALEAAQAELAAAVAAVEVTSTIDGT